MLYRCYLYRYIQIDTVIIDKKSCYYRSRQFTLTLGKEAYHFTARSNHRRFDVPMAEISDTHIVSYVSEFVKKKRRVKIEPRKECIHSVFNNCSGNFKTKRKRTAIDFDSRSAYVISYNASPPSGPSSGKPLKLSFTPAIYK